jgi:hypothetical protein
MNLEPPKYKTGLPAIQLQHPVETNELIALPLALNDFLLKF